MHDPKPTTRVHDPKPEHGWGTAVEVIVALIYALYGDGPTHLAFVRWDNGNGSWIDLAREDLTWENFNALEIPA